MSEPPQKFRPDPGASPKRSPAEQRAMDARFVRGEMKREVSESEIDLILAHTGNGAGAGYRADNLRGAIRWFSEHGTESTGDPRAQPARDPPPPDDERFDRYREADIPDEFPGWAKLCAADVIGAYRLVGGLTQAVYFLLLATCKRTGPLAGRAAMTQAQIAAQLGTKPSSINDTIERLRSHGLITTERDERGHPVMVVRRAGGKGADTIPPSTPRARMKRGIPPIDDRSQPPEEKPTGGPNPPWEQVPTPLGNRSQPPLATGGPNLLPTGGPNPPREISKSSTDKGLRIV